MKIVLIVLLILLNVSIFAYFQFTQTTAASQPLSELHPDKVKLLSEQEAQALVIPIAESSQ